MQPSGRGPSDIPVSRPAGLKACLLSDLPAGLIRTAFENTE